MVIMSFFLVFRRGEMKSLMKDILSQPALYFVIAIVTLILGLLMVTSHNIWVMGWPVVVTVIAWMVLISGILRLLFPEFAGKMGRKCIESAYGLWVTASVNFIIGAYLLYIVCVASA